MKFVLIVKLALSKPYAHWVERFDGHSEARSAAGIHTLFRYPVVGRQCAIYGVATETPRAVHDMIYDPVAREQIEESGFVIGSEEIVVCEADVLLEG